MEHKTVVILVDFEDGTYPEIEPSTYKLFIDNEECAIRDFIEDCISRANRFKEKNHFYPKNMEDVQGWEEIN